ncbi:MAG TPA: TonB family protein [Pyrinomonadaceae bacterium]|jgi:TonB family protein
MRKTLAALALALAASAVCLGQTNADAARQEVNLGARAYRAGRFAEAEQRFRRALELDPDGKHTRLFIARAVQQQYKPGDMTPENVAAGERALAAYQDILARDPANEDAYKATVFIYGQLKRDDKVMEMLTQRANDFSLPDASRAEAFTILASRQWNCSYEITEQKENKTTENGPDKILIHYKMPADAGDFIRARQCATDGLRLAEQATSLAPKNANAWSYKANLLREAAKLAEMEGDAAGKAEYDRQYAEALETQKSAAAAASSAVVAEEPTPPPAPAAGTGKRTVITGGILNGKAVSKPQPAYPAAAKAAGAQGTVTVRIVVDEGGNVVEAAAVSGPELLREAAVAAARRARFSPTRLSGQPVKVTGHVTYNFVLR